MIHIEQRGDIYILRGGKEFEKYGDPYSYSMIFSLQENGTIALIEALCRNGDTSLDRTEYREVNDGLKFMSVKQMKFERYKNGIKKIIYKDVI